jgi:hypothetical protein
VGTRKESQTRNVKETNGKKYTCAGTQSMVMWWLLFSQREYLLQQSVLDSSIQVVVSLEWNIIRSRPKLCRECEIVGSRCDVVEVFSPNDFLTVHHSISV